MSHSPNPILAGASILWARRVRRPRPEGDGTVDHAALTPILDRLRTGGVPALSAEREALAGYRRQLESVEPDTLDRDGALAFWINLYNAGALDLARRAAEEGKDTVLRVPGDFRAKWATVGGEALSLDDIEHGKVRRFRDPRIHAALVCSSASCPTLRYEPFRADALDEQLDDQMRRFLAAGAAVRVEDRVEVSRIFLWYGRDFTHPHRMPAVLPARHDDLLMALSEWMDPVLADWVRTGSPEVGFQSYDWALICSIG